MNIKITIILSFISITTFLHGMEQPFDALIPLGGDCQLAHQMRVNGLRKYALPLDWSISSPEALIKILDNKFHNYLNKENLEFVENFTENRNESYIKEKLYGINFVHEFKREKNFLDGYDTVKEKCDRRIERFFQVIEESKNPLFLRKWINKEQAIVLAALIKDKLVPGKNFTLLALDSTTTSEIEKPWGYPNIVNYYLRQPDPYVWQGDDQAWKEIFTNMGLKLGIKEDSCEDL